MKSDYKITVTFSRYILIMYYKNTFLRGNVPLRLKISDLLCLHQVTMAIVVWQVLFMIDVKLTSKDPVITILYLLSIELIL